MSLKRKASFPTFAPSDVSPFCAGAMVMIDDTPRHLNSRTRKRFRNDRPDDQTIYENTLRLLFTAQKEQVSSCVDEPMSLSPPPSGPESIDPRQQTLRKFFQPAQASSSSMRMESLSQNKGNGTVLKAVMIQNNSMDIDFSDSSADSGSDTSLSGETEMDVEMEMDYTGRESAMDTRRWIGGIGWL